MTASAPCPGRHRNPPHRALMPSSSECFQCAVAGVLSIRSSHERSPTHYAEKVPEWLPAVIRDDVPCRTINLVRDPRDVFLSARDFVRVRGAAGFGMDDGNSELDAARHTAHRWLSFAENARADRTRTDTMTLRYEDLVQEPELSAARLSTFLGLRLVPGEAPSEYLDSHRTSRDVGTSVGRWQREPLSDVVRTCLETQLWDLHGGLRLRGSGRRSRAVGDPRSSGTCLQRHRSGRRGNRAHICRNRRLQHGTATEPVACHVDGRDLGVRTRRYGRPLLYLLAREWRGVLRGTLACMSLSVQAVTGRSCGSQWASTRCGRTSSNRSA